MNAKRLFSLLIVGLMISLKVFSAENDSEKIRFYYKGDKGLSPKTCLYKIDNETRAQFISGFLPFGYNKTHSIGGFDIELLPGNHTFEIVLNDKSTMTKKSKKITAKKLTLKMEVGNEYILERNDFELNIICKSKSGKNKADFTIEDVTAFSEPMSGEPFATLKYIHEKKSKFDPYISRIDSKVTSNFGELFEACNYALPVDYKYFSGSKGELNLKIQPGIHTLEFLILGESVVEGLVQIEQFTFEAGKIYKILLDETKTKDKSKSVATIKIIEE
jgi:hypothetical protein